MSFRLFKVKCCILFCDRYDIYECLIIETPALTIPELSDDAKDRLDEVWRLSQDGMTPTQISKIFNERRASRKYSDKPYTPKDIGMIKLKYKKRLQLLFLDSYSSSVS